MSSPTSAEKIFATSLQSLQTMHNAIVHDLRREQALVQRKCEELLGENEQLKSVVAKQKEMLSRLRGCSECNGQLVQSEPIVAASLQSTVDLSDICTAKRKEREPQDAIIILDDEDGGDETRAKKADEAPPSPPRQKKFRYVAPVRKKAERAALKGRECEMCAGTYDALCDATGRGHGAANALDREMFVQCVSRHREVCTPPPKTPEEFWALGFNSPEGAVRSDASTQGDE